jgi:dihydroorotate dehydrogenase
LPSLFSKFVYKLFIKPYLFKKEAEDAHLVTFAVLKRLQHVPGFCGLLSLLFASKGKTVRAFGLNFPNAIGLAAGLDKNAELLKIWKALGFGFVEIGTVTPKAQAGNDRPRLFRLPQDEALINRMGFNNEGLQPIIERLKKRPKGLIVGGNIGKNKITPNEEAVQDYVVALNALYDHVDYFVVNVSSPNTPNLRALQDRAPLTEILNTLMALVRQKKHYKPLLLKIAPDLSESQLDDIVAIVAETKIDGVIAGNTTISRDALNTANPEQFGAGGLSGKPLRARSTEVVRYLYEKSNQSMAIIGVGGVQNPLSAIEKIQAGAVLVQVYTGFIYEGPAMIKGIVRKLAQ